jgi:tRNA-Thr(GGU) m(6)t(6)A37 methyltransferase TsaA
MSFKPQKENICLKAIGVIHSPFKKKEDTPLWDERSKIISRIEVYKEYEEGLADIEGFSHLFIFYWMNSTKPYSLKVIPRREIQLRGLFSTRAPNRPNPIGLTLVKLVARKKNILEVKGLDAFDGSPLLDIKPYTPDRFQSDSISLGWLEGKPNLK